MTAFGLGRSGMCPAIAIAGAAIVGLASIAFPADVRQPDAAHAPLAGAKRAAANLPRLHSLLVARRGELLLEYYGPRASAARLANVKSVSKSVISTLVGIALDRGLIKSLEQPVADFFPSLRRDPDQRKRTITIEDLVSMRSGLESTSGARYGSWVRAATGSSTR